MTLLLMLIACLIKNKDEEKIEQINLDDIQKEYATYKALPANYFLDNSRSEKDLILLGKKLFNEKALSATGQVSCNSCHNLSKAGTELHQFVVNNDNKTISRNIPTVLNAAGNLFQFWDGRVSTVENQVLASILSPNEMAMPNAEAAVMSLKLSNDYIEKFKLAFPNELDPITFQNIGIAIGSYEKIMVTPSRWDLFLSGDIEALSEEEIAGFITFNKSGCSTCHSDQLLGGTKIMKLGLANPWPNQKDLGRFEITKDEADKMMFKVPSLRNVSVTGPYFHDGSVSKLSIAIKIMAHHQLDIELTDEEALSIEIWLDSTAGIISGEW